MGSNKIVIDAWRMIQYQDNVDCLIIRHPTGVYYSNQCGGMLCTHPEFEGYALWVNEEMECEYVTHEHLCGMTYSEDWHQTWMQAASELNEYLSKLADSNTFTFEFDYDNIREMQEGCIPVLISGKWEQYDGPEYDRAPAILFTGNCD